MCRIRLKKIEAKYILVDTSNLQEHISRSFSSSNQRHAPVTPKAPSQGFMVVVKCHVVNVAECRW